MSHPTGEGAQSGAEGTQSGAGENTGANNGTTDPSTGAGIQSGTGTPPETPPAGVSREEFDAVRNRMTAADQRASKAEQELQKLRDKDLPEAEKLKRDYETSQKQVTELQATNQKLALEVAFLKDNTYTWHNPQSALKLVDMSQVTINEDGSVSGLKDALKALATSNDYLVKKEAAAVETPPAGTATGNNGGSSSTKPSTKGMAARLPALATRVRQG